MSLDYFQALLALVSGYALGSVSFAVLVARAKGVDIFSVGSGNPGATNVKRVLGKGPGNLVFALDAAKGALAAGWPLLAFAGEPSSFLLGLAGLAGAIAGHSFSVFLRFRGGKGVATTMGGLLVLLPFVLLIGLVLWLLVFYLSRIVAIASIAFGISLPVSAFVLGEPWPAKILTFVLAAVLLVRHRSNLRRLREGREHAFNKS